MSSSGRLYLSVSVLKVGTYAGRTALNGGQGGLGGLALGPSDLQRAPIARTPVAAVATGSRARPAGRPLRMCHGLALKLASTHGCRLVAERGSAMVQESWELVAKVGPLPPSPPLTNRNLTKAHSKREGTTK